MKPPVLMLIGAILLASGAVRVATGVGPAMALAEAQIETSGEDSNEVEGDINPVLQAMQERELRLEARERAIADRLHALATAEEELAKRLSELEQAEESLRAMVELSETANDDDIGRLTQVYENMKPADAAGLFEQMDPEFASGFIVRMQPEVAAAILAGLEPTTAYSISAIIAGRNVSAPTQ